MVENSIATTNRLVEECQGMVRFLAKQIRSRMPASIEMDDLISYGQIGLLQAAKCFDPSKGTKFSSFAYYRIRGAIFDGVNKLLWFQSARDRESKYNQMADSLLEEFANENPSADQSQEADLAREASWFTRMTGSLAVMQLALADEGSTPDVVDKSAKSPWSGIMEQETSRKLREAMEQIPPDAAALIRAVYFEDRTLQEAANRLGISESWASRMHAKALDQLAKCLRKLDPGQVPD